MVVSFDGDAGPAIGRPAPLFDRPVRRTGLVRSDDVLPKAKSVIFIEEDSGLKTIDLILNWSAELRRRTS